MEHENKEMLFPGSVDEWRSKDTRMGEAWEPG